MLAAKKNVDESGHDHLDDQDGQNDENDEDD